MPPTVRNARNTNIEPTATQTNNQHFKLQPAGYHRNIHRYIPTDTATDRFCIIPPPLARIQPSHSPTIYLSLNYSFNTFLLIPSLSEASNAPSTTTVCKYHHHLMQLGHVLTRSGLTCPEAPSKVCHDSSCQSHSTVSLPWVIYYGELCLHVVSSFSCIPVICPKLELFLTPLQFVYLFCNLPQCISRLFSVLHLCC
jgi:hypothetical protein